jgi:hypothetical protein
MLSLLLTLVAAPPASVAPADSFRYRIVTKSVQEVDASAVGQGSQNVEVSTLGLITVHLTDSAGGKVAHITVDSAHMDGGEMMAMLDPEMLKVPKGVFFHFFVKDGKVIGDPSPSAMSLPVVNMMGGIALLFTNPRPTAKIGDLWTDTTRIDTTTAQGKSSGSNIAKWKFAGMEANDRVLEADITGTMEVDSPMGKMSGTTSGKQRVVTRPQGPVVRLRSDILSDMVMALGTAAVNIRGTATVTVEPIP